VRLKARAKSESGGTGKLQSKRDIYKFIKFVIGIILIPACIGATIAFYKLFFIRGDLVKNQYWFIVGFVVYVIIYSILQNPIKTYVYGHELSHVLWTWLFKGKVKDFSATVDGGSVTVTKSNFLIALAPYFFSFYTFLAVLVYLVIISFWRIGHLGNDIFHFILGFSWAFHFVLTIYVILKEQDDIKENGALFSIFFIYLANIAFLGFLFVYLSEVVTLEEFIAGMTKQIKNQYLYIFKLGRV